ncbi:shikimate transporter [Cellulomonas denverensis]|uniref:Shikimate transporter n=1 Tax=Cellulomonas denverensis TaxID=264297 RepID=A0A7X6KWW7_9CELL|nr:shikimate transporter [Cellulomonas denverensis]NKY23673.1 shikimate transporter [Cellulomonas denverensis]GIG26846.1 MFS transporter [Cellulomonas denverensis]
MPAEVVEGLPADVTPRQARRAATSSFVGAVIEWYDFLIFGLTAATVFNTQFYAFDTPTMNLLASFATLGIGFLFRPLGGLVFGRMGDRVGQKQVLIVTMTLMGICTGLVGCLPTFAQVGWWSPILLTVLRSVQGFAVGGEWGGAALLAVRHAPSGRRAFYSCGVQLGYAVGLVAASGAVSGMSSLTGDHFESWGWRVPFWFSLPLIAVGLWIRSGVIEKPKDPATGQARRGSVLVAIRQSPKAFLEIIGLRLVELLTMYIVTTFAVAYGVSHLGMPREQMVDVALIVGALGLISIPTFAYLSDRFGWRRIYVIGALIGAAGAFPFFFAMESGSFLLVVVVAIVLINIAHDMAVSVQQPLITQMFGAEHQNTGAGVGYQVASAIAGGFTPFLATAMLAWADDQWWPVATYLLVGCLVSAAVAAFAVRGSKG